MTLEQFRLRVSAIIGLDTTSTGYEIDLIDAWVNEGVVDFLAKTKAHKRLLSMACTAGETEYTLDTDVISLEKLWLSPADGSTPTLLEPVTSGDFFQMRAIGAVGTDKPRVYAFEGANLLLVYPAPGSSSDTIQGVYVPRPTAMSTTAHSPASTAYGGIPEEFHPVILDYALWKAADYDDDSSSQIGLQYSAQYEKGCAQARAMLLRKTGVLMPQVKLGYPRPWPVSPGVDLGG